MKPRATLLLLLGLAGPGVLAAQEPGFTEIDHIVAVVGNVAIPFSRVQEQLNLARARGQTIPTDSTALLRFEQAIVNQLVDNELLYQQAEADTSIHVSDQQVQDAVDRAVRQIRAQFSSDVDFQRQLQASGFGTLAEYRRWIADQQRRDLLQQTLLQKLRQKGDLKPVPPTDAEMRAFYDQVKGQQTRPAIVSFRQIVIRPRPDSAAVVKAYHLADSLYIAITKGADFAALAKRFSDDPGSREQGGELGYFRRGQMVPAFDRVAFALKPGRTAPPVQTPFGFHVIQVERADPSEVEARHILIAPTITAANVEAAEQLADSIASLARGGASFDSLAHLYHDPTEQAFAEGAVLDSLPPIYRDAVDTSEVGHILGPLRLVQADSSVKFAVVHLEEKRPAGEYSYEELKDRIRDQLSAEASEKAYLDTLRSRTYVDVRLTP
jgi:peptidyl-prolyl cis-trans isomerase SurA